MLCHTTIWPAGNVAGLGEKDCAPLIATTLIVTAPGVGVGVGVGVVGDGVGEYGPEVLELPQPQAPRLNATMALATNTRILIPFCCYGSLCSQVSNLLATGQPIGSDMPNGGHLSTDVAVRPT
jgi:hypothetical protein